MPLTDSLPAYDFSTVTPDPQPVMGQDSSDVLTFLDDLPGYTSGSADPVGSTGSNPYSVDSNPNDTGGWQQTLLGIARIGLTGLQVYENGSVAAATPRALRPSTATTAPAITVGGTSFQWSTILFVGAGGILLIALLKSMKVF